MRRGSNASVVGRMTTSRVASEFPTDWANQTHSIVAGPDENMWFTLYNGEVVRITPSGTLTDCPL